MKSNETVSNDLQNGNKIKRNSDNADKHLGLTRGKIVQNIKDIGKIPAFFPSRGDLPRTAVLCIMPTASVAGVLRDRPGGRKRQEVLPALLPPKDACPGRDRRGFHDETTGVYDEKVFDRDPAVHGADRDHDPRGLRR
ncbi:MAG: hypothetical protein MR910_05635 [Clostridiales bacterium]|nr:hypothetical protein [Clostridiales bacterium]